LEVNQRAVAVKRDVSGPELRHGFLLIRVFSGTPRLSGWESSSV
jgi:hypothetical protein